MVKLEWYWKIRMWRWRAYKPLLPSRGKWVIDIGPLMIKRMYS